MGASGQSKPNEMIVNVISWLIIKLVPKSQNIRDTKTKAAPKVERKSYFRFVHEES